MPIFNVLIRVLIVTVIYGLVVTFLPLLLTGISTIALWLLSGLAVFITSFVFHTVGNGKFDLIDWS